MQWNYWSLRCSWSIACLRCYNNIFILNLTHGFYRLGKDNCKTRREAFKFWDLCLILEIWRWTSNTCSSVLSPPLAEIDPVSLVWEKVMMTSSNWNFSALLAFCTGNSPVSGEFPAQRPVTRSFNILFYMRLNKRLGKQWWCWWFETPSRTLWCHCNDRETSIFIFHMKHLNINYWIS